MDKLLFEEVRKIQLSMLGKFACFCNENGLRYFLDAGTLLGAVRHNGFIPWDDDVDVGMPRPDYERFIELARGGFGDTLVLLEPHQNIYPMLKIVDSSTYMVEYPDTIHNEIGVYIDVFPKDGIPDLSRKSYCLCKWVKFLILCNWFNKVIIFKWEKHGNVIRKIIAYIGRKIINEKNRDKPLKRLLKLATKYGFDESQYAATIIAGGMANCVKRECLESYELHKFENLMVNIPVGWDEYLTKLYGDYMTLPSEEKRVKHDNIAYRR